MSAYCNMFKQCVRTEEMSILDVLVTFLGCSVTSLTVATINQKLVISPYKLTNLQHLVARSKQEISKHFEREGKKQTCNPQSHRLGVVASNRT